MNQRIMFTADEQDMPPAYAAQQERVEREEQRIAEAVTDEELCAWLTKHPQMLAEVRHFDNGGLAWRRAELMQSMARFEPDVYAQEADMLCEFVMTDKRFAHAVADARRRVAAWKRA